MTRVLGRGFASAALILLLGVWSAAAGRGGAARDEKAGAPIEAHELAARFAFYQDDYLRNYVDAVGRRLLSVRPRADRLLSFAILDRGAPMLLATADDRVYLSRGLLALLQSEDELAGLLAHEIAHLLAGHAERRAVSATEVPRWLRGGELGALLAADLRQAAGIAPFEALQLPLAAFAASEEQAVDRLALQRVAAAGYDPGAITGFLERVARVSALLDTWRTAPFLQRHGFSGARIAALRVAAGGLSWQAAQPFAGSRQALLKRLDGLYWGDSNPQQGLFIGARFVQPDLGIDIDFPTGWTPVNTPRFVAAVQPDGEAVVQLGTAGPAASPVLHANDFTQRLRRETGLEAAPERVFSAGPWQGRLLRADATAARPPLAACYAWVQGGGTIFRLIGAGQAEHAAAFCAAVQTLRPLAADVRKDITTRRLRVVEALDGEQLAGLGERSGNEWSPALTAAVNDLDAQALLSAGDRIRILRAEPYY